MLQASYRDRFDDAIVLVGNRLLGGVCCCFTTTVFRLFIVALGPMFVAVLLALLLALPVSRLTLLISET
jgi:hypothetical protein